MAGVARRVRGRSCASRRACRRRCCASHRARWRSCCARRRARWRSCCCREALVRIVVSFRPPLAPAEAVGHPGRGDIVQPQARRLAAWEQLGRQPAPAAPTIGRCCFRHHSMRHGCCAGGVVRERAAEAGHAGVPRAGIHACRRQLARDVQNAAGQRECATPLSSPPLGGRLRRPAAAAAACGCRTAHRRRCPAPLRAGESGVKPWRARGRPEGWVLEGSRLVAGRAMAADRREQKR